MLRRTGRIGFGGLIEQVRPWDRCLGWSSSRHCRCVRDQLDVFFIVPGHIPGLLGTFEFQLVLPDNRLLDQIPASLIDRVRDIGVELIRRSFDILQILIAS